jgi:hypothetical protein
MPVKYTAEQRAAAFWAKVDLNGPIPAHQPDLGPCWIWKGAHHPDGRGSFGWGNRRTRYAHVVAYILTTGHEPPPETPKITHLCDGGFIGCVRPSHLKADTQAGNLAGMVARGRSARGARSGARKHLQQRPRGDGHWNARLDAATVLAIRTEWQDSTMSMTVFTLTVGARHGVSYKTIEDLLLRRTWRHL